MKVDTIHPEYSENCTRWELIRAIVANKAKQYIRTIDKNDVDRSNQYRDDAILTNFTNLTCVGLTGLVFRQDIRLNMPPELDYLIENFTGSGINIYQFSQSLVAEILKIGRAGLFIDYYDAGSKAYIKTYCAESIINWKTKASQGENVLSLVVLVEYVLDDKEDIFSQEKVKQYRVLYLDDSNIYRQHIFNESLELIETITPVDFFGNTFNKLPFIFIGSENNDSDVDYQPLYDLAVLNLGHYRNSADYEESIFISGQPFLHLDVGDTNTEEFMKANPGGVLFGSRKMLVTSGGGTTLLQANANQLVAQAMNEKLDQAARIGARLIEQAAGTRETAEGARIRYGAQNSALTTLTANINYAIEDALEICCQFMNADVELVQYKLNDQFYDKNADPNLIAQQLMMLDRGIMTKEEIRKYAEDTGFINVNNNQEVTND